MDILSPSMKRLIGLLIVSVSASCSSPPEVQLGPSGWLPEGGYYEKVVHYGTTRPDSLDAAVPASTALRQVTRLNSGNTLTHNPIAYGRAKVLIPYDKSIGGTEGMSVSELIHDIGWKQFSAGIASDDLVVFVHGFATTFTDAAIRTAQLAHDTNFHGEAVLFSWPSGGSVTQYDRDKERANENVAPLAEFLTMLANNTGKRIHVVAHSMGTYILVRSLAWIGQHTQVANTDILLLRQKRQGRLFAQIILAAPDIRTDDYLASFGDYDLSSLAERVTLYSSHNDGVLVASRIVNTIVEGSSEARLGDSSKAFSVTRGMDTVDARQEIAPQFFGHSFYAQYPALVSDIHELLTHELPPEQRMLQRVSDARGQHLWFIRATSQTFQPGGGNADETRLLPFAAMVLVVAVMLTAVMIVQPWTVDPSRSQPVGQGFFHHVRSLLRWILLVPTAVSSVPLFFLAMTFDSTAAMLVLSAVTAFLVTWLMGFVAPSLKVLVAILVTMFLITANLGEYGLSRPSVLLIASLLATPLGSAMAGAVWWKTIRNRRNKTP
jgi:pimeloyl-ACP methyl ester carboxylesterase